MSDPGHLQRVSDFGLRTSEFGMPLKSLPCGLVLALALPPDSLLACAACYGQSDSPMAAGMNWGILSLLVVIATVLGGVASFFIYLAKRSAGAPLVASKTAALQYGQSAPVLGSSDVHKHFGAGGFRPVGRVGHRCARGRAQSDTVIFSDGMRQIVPGSAHPTL